MGAEESTIGSWESKPKDAAKHPASHKTVFQKEKKIPYNMQIVVRLKNPMSKDLV